MAWHFYMSFKLPRPVWQGARLVGGLSWAGTAGLNIPSLQNSLPRKLWSHLQLTVLVLTEHHIVRKLKFS